MISETGKIWKRLKQEKNIHLLQGWTVFLETLKLSMKIKISTVKLTAISHHPKPYRLWVSLEREIWVL